jgi:hypothetical protein
MLKIDNLSNEIDATAVIGGSTNQVNELGISMGGVSVSQGAGLLSASSVTYAPAVLASQSNSAFTSNWTSINETAEAALFSTAVA